METFNLKHLVLKIWTLKKYLGFIDNVDVGSINLLFIMKIKDNDNKVKRYLISSRDLAVLLKLNSFFDTTLQSIVKKAMLGEDIGFTFDSKINEFLIPEHMYEKYRKKSITEKSNSSFQINEWPLIIDFRQGLTGGIAETNETKIIQVHELSGRCF